MSITSTSRGTKNLNIFFLRNIRIVRITLTSTSRDEKHEPKSEIQICGRPQDPFSNACSNFRNCQWQLLFFGKTNRCRSFSILFWLAVTIFLADSYFFFRNGRVIVVLFLSLTVTSFKETVERLFFYFCRGRLLIFCNRRTEAK